VRAFCLSACSEGREDCNILVSSS